MSDPIRPIIIRHGNDSILISNIGWFHEYDDGNRILIMFHFSSNWHDNRCWAFETKEAREKVFKKLEELLILDFSEVA